jgi:tetratricopeptide (TPR) repeat protein
MAAPHEQALRDSLAAAEAQKDYHGAANAARDLGFWLRDRGKFGEAEAMLRKALAHRESEVGKRHPEVARSLADLAEAMAAGQAAADGERCCIRAEEILRDVPPDDPSIRADVHSAWGAVMRAMGRTAEAAEHERKAASFHAMPRPDEEGGEEEEQVAEAPPSEVAQADFGAAPEPVYPASDAQGVAAAPAPKKGGGLWIVLGAILLIGAAIALAIFT